MDKGTRTETNYSLEALRAGDKAEFAKIVDAYSGVIYRLVNKMVNDPQDAEDLLQETFLKAYRHFSSFDGRSSISTWLYRIATNEALMLLRRRKKNTVSIDAPVEPDAALEEPIQIIDWCCMPEEELVSAEAKQYLNQAVELLPPGMRAVFLLRDIEGLSTQEAGEVLNLSEAAVKTRLSRARMRLRELLSVYFAEKMNRQHILEESET